jgi:hypothetical protein
MINNQITAKWVDEITDTIAQLTMKHLDVGYADNQPRWPYWVQPYNYSSKELLDIDSWMREIFGNTDWSTPGGRWVGSDRKYWFRNEADRTMFLLKWS